MGLLKNIYWQDNTKNTIVYKMDLKNDYISKGSALTVRDGQAAVFCHKGQMADVFLPGFYKLDTNSIPLVTKLMSWKYGFENVFRSDVYFVNTTQFTNEKWGTVNPVILRDKDYGAIRIRGFGTYSFRVSDPYVFLQELSGTRSTFRTQDITEYLRSMLLMGISDALGESKIPLLDMAGNLIELSREVTRSLSEDFEKIGIELCKFNFENFSLPEELEKAFDKNASLGMLKNNMGTYMQMAQADALVEAAKNQGTAGAFVGAGLGMGAGHAFGNMFNQQSPQQQQSAPTCECKGCGATIKQNARFCPECGKPCGNACSKCKATFADGAKFCPECGTPTQTTCPLCNATVKPNAKFCPDCGGKLK